MGGVVRGGHTHVEKDFGDTGRVAVAVPGIGLGTGAGIFRPARGLRILPSGDVGGACRSDRGRRRGAAVRGWTRILVDEDRDRVEMLCGHLFADVLGCRDGFARLVLNWLAAEVDAWEIARGGDSLGPP